jgi:hypothetical protein
MLVGMFGQAVLGLGERARHTDSAYVQVNSRGNLNEVSATR